MTRPKILVTRAIFPEILSELAKHCDLDSNQDDILMNEATLIARLAGVDGVITTSAEKVGANLLDQCPQLRVVANMAVGFNNIDLDAATARKVMVTNTPDVLTETTADFAWALLLATARRVSESEHWLRAGHWQTWRYDTFLGADVHGSTIGILGMGRIGQAIARRSQGFNTRVIYHNRSRLTAIQEAAANNAQWVSKEELLARSDHLILVLPYSATTHHAISKCELESMQAHATLVNIARGGIVDDLALINALRDNRIAAAGLDVYENEPAFDSRFLELPNVVLTPHIASASRATRLAMASCAARNLLAALAGQRPPNLLNAELWPE